MLDETTDYIDIPLFKPVRVKSAPMIVRPPIGVRTIHAWTISASKSWDARKRAHLAARWALGLLTVTPTVKLAATVFGVNLAYVNDALRELDGIKPPSSLLSAYMNASAEEKLAAARAIGVDRIWDEMVSPVVS